MSNCPLVSVYTGTGCGGNVTTTGRHPAPSPCWGCGLGGGAQPGLGSTSGLRGQPAAGGHDEADDGDRAGEAGADAHDGAAETAAVSGAEAAAAAATAGRTGEGERATPSLCVHRLGCLPSF